MMLIIIFHRHRPFILCCRTYTYLLSLWWCCVLTTFQPQLMNWENNKKNTLNLRHLETSTGIEWKRSERVSRHCCCLCSNNICIFHGAAAATTTVNFNAARDVHRYLIFPLTLENTLIVMGTLTDVHSIEQTTYPFSMHWIRIRNKNDSLLIFSLQIFGCVMANTNSWNWQMAYRTNAVPCVHISCYYIEALRKVKMSFFGRYF